MLDLSTPAGRAFASISATFAQFERETIAARVRDAWHKLRESGKYGGGQVPFGYRPVKLGKGWGYEPDPEYGSTARYGDKTYAYYCCVHSLRRDGKCTARRVKANEIETAISDELLALAGDIELTEDKVIPGLDFSEDINRTVEQMTHLYEEVQLAALAGEDVTGKQETLQRDLPRQPGRHAALRLPLSSRRDVDGVGGATDRRFRAAGSSHSSKLVDDALTARVTGSNHGEGQWKNRRHDLRCRS